MRHRQLLTIACLFTVSMWPLTAAVAETVGDILDRAERALGDPAVVADVDTVRIHSHGIWEMPSYGVPATKYVAVSVFGRPNRARVEWTLPTDLGGEFTFGYDGKEAWGIWGAPPARCKSWHRDVIRNMTAELQLFLTAPGQAEYRDSFAFAVDSREETPGAVKLTCRPFADAEPWWDSPAGES